MTDHDPISLDEGEHKRDEGMGLVALPDPYEKWASNFENAAMGMLRAGRRRITSEDVLAVVGLPPGDHRQVGPIMRKIALTHSLRKIGVIKAARVSRHAGNVTVWEMQ